MNKKPVYYCLILIVTTLGYADSSETTTKEKDIKSKVLFEGKEFYDQRLQKIMQSKKEGSSKEVKKQDTNMTKSFKLQNTGKKE